MDFADSCQRTGGVDRAAPAALLAALARPAPVLHHHRDPTRPRRHPPPPFSRPSVVLIGQWNPPFVPAPNQQGRSWRRAGGGGLGKSYSRARGGGGRRGEFICRRARDRGGGFRMASSILYFLFYKKTKQKQNNRAALALKFVPGHLSRDDDASSRAQLRADGQSFQKFI